MSSSLRQIISTFLAAAAVANAAFGPAFSTGPVGSGSWIRESTATLVLPDAPSNNAGDLSLWVGMGTSNGDLIQSIAENWQSDKWSIFAYTLVKTGGECSRVEKPRQKRTEISCWNFSMVIESRGRMVGDGWMVWMAWLANMQIG